MSVRLLALILTLCVLVPACAATGTSKIVYDPCACTSDGKSRGVDVSWGIDGRYGDGRPYKFIGCGAHTAYVDPSLEQYFGYEFEWCYMRGGTECKQTKFWNEQIPYQPVDQQKKYCVDPICGNVSIDDQKFYASQHNQLPSWTWRGAMWRKCNFTEENQVLSPLGDVDKPIYCAGFRNRYGTCEAVPGAGDYAKWWRLQRDIGIFVAVTAFLFVFFSIYEELIKFPSIIKEDLGFARLISIHTLREHTSVRGYTSTYGGGKYESSRMTYTETYHVTHRNLRLEYMLETEESETCIAEVEICVAHETCSKNLQERFTDSMKELTVGNCIIVKRKGVLWVPLMASNHDMDCPDCHLDKYIVTPRLFRFRLSHVDDDETLLGLGFTPEKSKGKFTLLWYLWLALVLAVISVPIDNVKRMNRCHESQRLARMRLLENGHRWTQSRCNSGGRLCVDGRRKRLTRDATVQHPKSAGWNQV